ncbi:MAG: hypothetical protein ACYCTB_03170 [bacterium]
MTDINKDEKISRRGFIGKIIKVAPLLFAPFFLTEKLIKNAYAKDVLASKTSVKYQHHSNNGEMCGMCIHFIPPKGMKMNMMDMMMGGGGMMNGGSKKGGTMPPYGTCQVVEGKIDQMGWCILYKPKMGNGNM